MTALAPAARLPEADWRRDPALLRLLDALDADAGTTRAVGGAVRDTLLGLAVADIDLATRWLPQDVIDRLTAADIKAVPTGIAHGTITAVSNGKAFEVTTLRRDVSTDGRHAHVAFTDDWAADAARRDFTINALYADPRSGKVFDPVGGLADLAARRVRFIGDAATRIDEDHLRILRWFRFLARFGDGAPDAETLSIIAGRAAKLRGLSRERIADELGRIMALPDPVQSARLMEQCGVLAQIIPEALPGAADRLAVLIGNERAASASADPVRRLIALLPADAALADGVAARLKLSKRMGKRIAAARGGAVSTPIRALAYRIGVEAALDRLLLGDGADLAARMDLDGWAVPRMLIGGGDLVAMGVPPGPLVARTLHAVENQWIAEDFPDRVRTLVIAQAHIDSGLPTAPFSDAPS